MGRGERQIRAALDSIGYSYEGMRVEFEPGGEMMLMEGWVANGWSVDGWRVGPNAQVAAAYVRGEDGADELWGQFFSEHGGRYHPRDPDYDSGRGHPVADVVVTAP